jgi:hypothetical protein
MNASRNTKIGAIAITAVALVAAGGAFAAGKYHGSKATARSGLTPSQPAPTTQNRRFGFGPGAGPGFGRGNDLAAAATYLGLTQSDLQTAVRSGKTLAQIANGTSGKSSSGLIAALVGARKTELEQAVTAGTITQAQADQFTAMLKERITNLVNGVRPAHGGFGRPGGFGGPPPSGSSPGGFQPTPSTGI